MYPTYAKGKLLLFLSTLLSLILVIFSGWVNNTSLQKKMHTCERSSDPLKNKKHINSWM
jgi:hypothetical protein